MIHDQKKQLRSLKRKTKKLGNQKTRHHNKQLLKTNPDAEELLEDTKPHPKLLSHTLNGTDTDKTRNTPHHQKTENQPMV